MSAILGDRTGMPTLCPCANYPQDNPPIIPNSRLIFTRLVLCQACARRARFLMSTHFQIWLYKLNFSNPNWLMFHDFFSDSALTLPLRLWRPVRAIACGCIWLFMSSDHKIWWNYEWPLSTSRFFSVKMPPGIFAYFLPISGKQNWSKLYEKTQSHQEGGWRGNARKKGQCNGICGKAKQKKTRAKWRKQERTEDSIK